MSPLGDVAPHGNLVSHHELAPGETCEGCGRRVPYPKRESSPTTRVRSYRLPVDEAEAHEDVLVQAAKHLGTHERPNWMFQTYTIALALVLQDESLRGFAHRSAT